jgi:hypothetical protein
MKKDNPILIKMLVDIMNDIFEECKQVQYREFCDDKYIYKIQRNLRPQDKEV